MMLGTVHSLQKRKVIKINSSVTNLFKRILFFFFILLVLQINTVSAQVESEIFLEGASVTDIAKESDYLWVVTYGQGVYRYSIKDQKWSNYSTKTGSIDTDLFYTIAVNKDYVWAGGTEGLYILNKKTQKWSKRKFAQGGQYGNWIRALKYDAAHNVLWIGRFRNVTRLDVKRRRYVDIDRTHGKDQKSNDMKTISFDGDSLVWLGSESGVHVLELNKNYNDKSAWRYITNKDRGFMNEGETVSISSILFEGNNIWFGTDEFTSSKDPGFNVGGIYIYDRKLNWQKISQIDGLADNGIYALGRTGNYIWAGVYSFESKDNIERGRGLFLINRNTLEVTKVDLDELKVASSSFQSFLFDGKNMWVGSGAGLLKISISNPLAKWQFKGRSSQG